MEKTERGGGGGLGAGGFFWKKRPFFLPQGAGGGPEKKIPEGGVPRFPPPGPHPGRKRVKERLRVTPAVQRPSCNMRPIGPVSRNFSVTRATDPPTAPFEEPWAPLGPGKSTCSGPAPMSPKNRPLPEPRSRPPGPSPSIPAHHASSYRRGWSKVVSGRRNPLTSPLSARRPAWHPGSRKSPLGDAARPRHLAPRHAGPWAPSPQGPPWLRPAGPGTLPTPVLTMPRGLIPVGGSAFSLSPSGVPGGPLAPPA